MTKVIFAALAIAVMGIASNGAVADEAKQPGLTYFETRGATSVARDRHGTKRPRAVCALLAQKHGVCTNCSALTMAVLVERTAIRKLWETVVKTIFLA